MLRTVPMLMLVALLPACTDDNENGPLDTPGFTVGGVVRTNAVVIQHSTFFPAAIRVPFGSVVTFKNFDNIEHNVIFFSPVVASIPDWAFGSRTTILPLTGGSFHFFCSIHPWMTGVIHVGPFTNASPCGAFGTCAAGDGSERSNPGTTAR